MSMRHSDSDGSDIFWPGYVDAVTNLVLSLLFLLTIMTVAVFMFALELGRASLEGPTKQQVATTKRNKTVPAPAPTDPVKENIALKREIQRLNLQLAQVSQSVPGAKSGNLVTTVDASSPAPHSQNGLDKMVVTDSEIIVRFTNEAVAFTPEEHDRFLESLKPVVAGGRASIHVEVPTGFSEAKRMGFYRAMAVRNLLLEMKMPKDRIDMSVREGKKNASASLVRVRYR